MTGFAIDDDDDDRRHAGERVGHPRPPRPWEPLVEVLLLLTLVGIFLALIFEAVRPGAH